MSERRSWLVVANESAGSVEADAVAAAVAVLAGHGEAELVHIGDDLGVDEAVSRAAGRVVVAAGGDGTLHVVVGALHRADTLTVTPVGLIPMGTGNDFARSAGIPIDPEAAARFLVQRPTRSVDLLMVDGTPAINAVHFGLGVAAAEAASKVKVLGPLAYALGGVAAGVRAEPVNARVRVDGELVAEGPLDVVAIANGGTIGGGTSICPPARLDDGAADVVVFEHQGRWARGRFGLALRRGAHLGGSGVSHHRGGCVEIERRSPTDVNVDGELKVLPAEWAIDVRRRAWELAGGGPPVQPE